MNKDQLMGRIQIHPEEVIDSLRTNYEPIYSQILLQIQNTKMYSLLEKQLSDEDSVFPEVEST